MKYAIAAIVIAIGAFAVTARNLAIPHHAPDHPGRPGQFRGTEDRQSGARYTLACTEPS